MVVITASTISPAMIMSINCSASAGLLPGNLGRSTGSCRGISNARDVQRRGPSRPGYRGWRPSFRCPGGEAGSSVGFEIGRAEIVVVETQPPQINPCQDSSENPVVDRREQVDGVGGNNLARGF